MGQPVLRYNGIYLPAKFINIMKYTEQWQVTTAGGVQAYVYKMNSVYDPYSGAGGNGCYGIDWFQATYNRYRVLRATLIVTTAAGADKENTMIYLYASASSTAAVISTAESAPGSRAVMLSEYRPQTLTITSTPSRWLFGANDRDISAVTNADPALLAYFHILLKNISGAALGVNLHVTVLYETEWSELKQADDIDDA
jgi:hypothetical protein